MQRHSLHDSIWLCGTNHLKSSFESGHLAFTANREILDTLSLLRGVRAFYYDGYESTDATMSDIQGLLKSEGYVENGERVVITASMPIGAKGMTNALKVSTVD